MSEPNGLLARLSRILFILRPESPGKQQVVARRLSSGIRRLLDEREAFSVLSSGILAWGVGVCVWQRVCVHVCVCAIPRAKPYKWHFAKSIEAKAIQVGTVEGLQRGQLCPPSPLFKPVPVG